jgi:hypothetical protein
MTDKHLPGSMPPQRGETLAEERGTAQIAKDQASGLGHSSAETGKHVAGVAREQASDVAAEAGRQGRDLLRQLQDQLEEQAAHGQQRVAKQLLSLGDELHAMADDSGHGGPAAGLAEQAGTRIRDAGHWLDARKPGQVVNEMQSFARRRPAVFLVLAAGAGLVAGRITRGLKGATDGSSTAAAAPPAQGLGEQPAQRSDVRGYAPATAVLGGSDDQPAREGTL